MRAFTGALALALFSACAVHRFVPPAGPGQPAPDGAGAWDEATATCRDTSAHLATLKLSGRLGRREIPGFRSAALNVAVTNRGEIGLEARSSGQLVFSLGGSTDRAVLLWQEGRRVLEAPAGEIVDALIGVRLGPERLLAMLGGCALRSANFERAERLGAALRVQTSDGLVYLERLRGRWTIRAIEFDGFLVSYEWRADGTMAGIRIDSARDQAEPVAISLAVVVATRNPSVPASAFVVRVPDGATPMTLAELRSWRENGS